MLLASRTSGLGIYVNEMQRSINGLGHGPSGIIPYGRWSAYHPGGLGDVPNDFEASRDLQYIPVRQGWYYGYPIDGRGYPDVRRGLGENDRSAIALQQLTKYERTQTVLQAISTFSIATIAVLTVARAVVAIRRRSYSD